MKDSECQIDYFIIDPGSNGESPDIIELRVTWLNLSFRKITLVAEQRMDWSEEKLVASRPTSRLLQ